MTSAANQFKFQIDSRERDIKAVEMYNCVYR